MHKGPMSDAVYEKIKRILCGYSVTKGVCGMALGADIIFAMVCLDLGIPLIAAIPFKGQELKWSKANQEQYYKILSHPLVTKYTVCEGGYASWKMQKRNIWMVNQIDMLIGVWDGSSGGTFNCLEYARTHRTRREIINPKLLLL